MNKKNNNQLLNYITIENLKNSLLGKAISMSKGTKLELFFNYFIQLKEKGGDALVNLEEDTQLFNYIKGDRPRMIEVDMVGLVEATKNNSLNEYDFKLLNYDFYGKDTIRINYGNITFEYNIEKQKLKQIDLIEFDLCNELKSIGKKQGSEGSQSSNLFEKAKKEYERDSQSFGQKLNKKNIDKNLLNDYINTIGKFLFYMKDEFNSAQRGLPNLIKFFLIKNNKKEEKNNFLFHIRFTRELDGGYRVKAPYNFEQKSGLKELKCLKNKTNEKKNFDDSDILLFELKDSAIPNTAYDCLKENYKVLNGYIKVLKKKDEFKNCQFFYIGIQEMPKKYENKNEEINESQNCDDIFNLDLLKIKFYTFTDGIIFGEEYRKLEPKKVEVLNLLREKHGEIDMKFEKLENKFDERIEKLENKFDERIEKLENKFDERIENLEKKFDKRIADLEKKIDLLIDNIPKYKNS